MPRGGARPGAGRKPRREKYATKINAAERKVADRLPELVDNLMRRADGGYEMVTEEWVPAGTVMVDHMDWDDKGRAVRGKVNAFPDLGPTDLVLIKRTVEVADADVRANEYLLDRIMDKPSAGLHLSGVDGAPIEVEVSDGSVLSDDKRAEAITRLLDRVRTRAAGPAEPGQPDLGAAGGPTV